MQWACRGLREEPKYFGLITVATHPHTKNPNKPANGKDGRFTVGNPGGDKPKGATSIRTRVLRDAALLACEACGEILMTPQYSDDGKFIRMAMEKTGKGGLTGYLEWMAMYQPKAMATILAKILPTQITVQRKPAEIFETLDDLRRELDGRGITLDQLMHPVLNLEANGVDGNDEDKISED